MAILVFVTAALLANMNLSAWKTEKKEKKKIGDQMNCCYGFNRSIEYVDIH